VTVESPDSTGKELRFFNKYGEKAKNQADGAGVKFWVSGKMQSSGPDAGSASSAKDKE